MNNKPKHLFEVNLEDSTGDFYYTLCNVAGAMLQGQTVTFLGQTYKGNEARHAGLKLVELINEFQNLMKHNK